jgi:anti-anti-sigma regulatory factor
MPEVPSPGVTVAWGEGLPTVTVHGALDPDGAAQAREKIAEVLRDSPQGLVLDLHDVSDRYSAECLALIAVVRHLLRPGCTLTVRSSSQAVRQVLRLAGWSGVRVSGSNEEPEAV